MDTINQVLALPQQIASKISTTLAPHIEMQCKERRLIAGGLGVVALKTGMRLPIPYVPRGQVWDLAMIGVVTDIICRGGNALDPGASWELMISMAHSVGIPWIAGNVFGGVTGVPGFSLQM